MLDLVAVGAASGPEEEGGAPRLADFDFELPAEQIAQHPPPHREDARLMILERNGEAIDTGRFRDIADHFREGDLLVLNDTRVMPARLLGRRDTGGRVEVLLVRRRPGQGEVWACLTRASKPLRPGTRLSLAGGIEAVVLGEGDPPYRLVEFACSGEEFLGRLETAGRIPLPPYIRREDDARDRERYQTVFAREPGAVAAPTAGLHFTEAIFETLRRRGVELRPLTLHVGLGTFLPVRSDDLRGHRMHTEEYHVPGETATAVDRAKREGRRVIALGTTTTRALESAVGADGRLQAGRGSTEIFIYPGFRFRVVDGMITNFHLPRSTLLMLVAAFAGRESVLEAYRRAVAEGFRFFSYGDCMLIL